MWSRRKKCMLLITPSKSTEYRALNTNASDTSDLLSAIILPLNYVLFVFMLQGILIK